MSLDILCVTPSSSSGWGPVTAFAQLAGEIVGTSPTYFHPTKAYGNLRKLAAFAPRLKGRRRALLIIASHPGDLLAIARLDVLLGRYDQVGAWIFDSFWDDRIPLFARKRSAFDHLWITDAELVPTYSALFQMDVGWLPWGTDAVRAAQIAHDDNRAIDVFRLGRQPAAWNDDAINATLLKAHSLTYQGRFPDAKDGVTNQANVQRHLANAKVVLASSNTASPSDYTHPTRQYISARFTDAAAAGTRIVGVPPQCEAAALLPSELWVPISVNRRDDGLNAIRQAVSRYSPDRARRLRARALKNLDWRHRLNVITSALNVNSLAVRESVELTEVIAERMTCI